MPAGLRLTGRPVLVIGGGRVALRKIRLLLKCRARVTLISPDVRPGIRRLADGGKIVWRRRRFHVRDGFHPRPVLVFVCTRDVAANDAAARRADREGIFVNRADCPDGSTLHVPAIARLGPLTAAISSGGLAPVYVRHVRRRIETLLGPGVRAEVKLARDVRRELKARVKDQAERRRILTQLVESGELAEAAAQPAGRRRAALSKWLKGL